MAGWSPGNGNKITIELLDKGDDAGGRGGGTYLGLNPGIIGWYNMRTFVESGKIDGIILHEMGHCFTLGRGGSFNVELAAHTMAYYVAEKTGTSGKDYWSIDNDYADMVKNYKTPLSWDDVDIYLWRCLWKFHKDTNWEPLKKTLRSYYNSSFKSLYDLNMYNSNATGRDGPWEFLERLSFFSKKNIETYFYKDLGTYVRKYYPEPKIVIN